MSPERIQNIDKILKEFNAQLFGIMDKYKSPYQIKKLDEELKNTCKRYSFLAVNYPETAGKKVVNFIKSYITV